MVVISTRLTLILSIFSLCFVLPCRGSNDVLWKSWSDEPWTWGDFLEERYYETLKSFENFQDETNLLYIRERSKRNVHGNTNVQFRILSTMTEEVSKNIDSSVIFYQLSGQNYILVDENIHRIHQHEDGQIFIEFVESFDVFETILGIEIFKTTEVSLKNTTFVALFYKKYTEILKIEDVDGKGHLIRELYNNGRESEGRIMNNLNRKYYKQRISNGENSDVLKGKFFELNGNLYFIILFNNGEIKTDSGLYKWSGSHFNEIVKITTESATDLAIISSQHRVIIVFPQNSKNHEMLRKSLQIFEFDDKNGLRRKYSLSDGKGNILALPYKAFSDDISYLLIISAGGPSKTYKITNDGIVWPTNREYSFKNIKTALIWTITGRNFIFLAKKNKISIFLPNEDELLKINTIDIEESHEIQALDYMDLTGEFYGLNILSKKNKITYHTIIKLEITEDAIVSAEKLSDVEKCFTDLEYMLNGKQTEIDILKKQISQIEEIKDPLHIPGEVIISQSKIDSIHLSSVDNLKLNITSKELLDLIESTERLLDQAEDLSTYMFVDDDEVFKVKNDVEITDELTVNNLQASHIKVDLINNYPFTTKDFILQKEGQYIPEELLHGKEIKVRKLSAPVFNDILEDALVLSSLSADNLLIPQEGTINGIDPEEIVSSQYSGFIKGIKSFNTILSRDVQVEVLNHKQLTPWLMEAINRETPTNHLLVNGDVEVVDLKVKNINGGNFQNLMESVFLKGNHTTVEGNLHIQSELTVDSLKAETLEQIPIQKFFTKTTPQNIKSKIIMKSILVDNLDANTINGINFSKDVAVIGKQTVVKSPTTIFNLDVLQDLLLNCGTGEESFCNITTIRPEDLLQIYNRPVTIVGSLTVRDLKFGSNTNVTVDNREFATDIASLFWVRDKNQVIPNDVVFEQELTVPHISAITINGIPVTSLVSVHDISDVNLHFNYVKVRQDVTTEVAGDCNRIMELNDTTVRNHGRVNVYGRKTFANKLITQHLGTQFVNNENVTGVVSKFMDNIIIDEMRFERIKMTGNLQVHTDIGAEVVNGIVWLDFVDRTVRIDLPIYLDTAIFHGSVNANSVKVQASKYLPLTSELSDYAEVDITVIGNCSIRSIYGNEVINNINIEKYSKKVVRKDDPAIISGEKTFKGDVFVSEDFQSETLDNISLEKLMLKALTKSGDQVVFGKFTVGDVKTDHLITDSLNDIPISDFIDINDNEIIINSDIVFENDINVTNHLIGNMSANYNVTDIMTRFSHLGKKKWGKVIVNGNLEWKNMDEKLERIFGKSIKKNEDAFINSKVRMDKRVSANRIFMIDSNIDGQLRNLIDDSVKKLSDVPQIITGKKHFKNNLYTSYATLNNITTRSINGVFVKNLYTEFVRKFGDQEIYGRKEFTGNIKIKHLKIPGKIHNVSIDNIIQKSDANGAEKARFKQLVVNGDLNVRTVNGEDISDMLNNAIKLKGGDQIISGPITFESLNIGDSKIKSINSIPLDDVIFDQESADIHIYGDKTFIKSATIDGPVDVKIVNGMVISTEQDSLKPDNFGMSHKPVEGNGEETNEHLSFLSVANGKKFPGSLEFLHTEKLNNVVGISSRQSKIVNVVSTRDKTILDIHNNIPGTLCGLMDFCHCPQQFKIVINEKNEASVHEDLKRGMRSFFVTSPPAYSTKLVTTTVSTSRVCREDSKNIGFVEGTWISWSLSGQLNEEFTDVNSIISGYVSDVKSFTLNNWYYMIVCQYYDRTKDDHRLETVVMVLDFDKKSFIVLQRIPSYGAWTSHMIQTSSGIFYILGNTLDAGNGIELPILRFNPLNSLFEIIQVLNVFGCKSLASLTTKDHDMAPFLLINQGHSLPVIILKYNVQRGIFEDFQIIHQDVEVLDMGTSTVKGLHGHYSYFLHLATSDEHLITYNLHMNGEFIFFSSKFIRGLNSLAPISINEKSFLYLGKTDGNLFLRL